MKQALSGTAFLLGIVGVIAILFLSSVQDMVTAFRSARLLAGGFHHSLIMKALSSDGMTLALPIFAALPFTSSMMDDVKCGFIKEYLPRTTVSGYLAGKIAACILLGGLVFVFGILTAYGIAALIFTPLEAAGAELTGKPEELLGQIVLFFVSGGFWAMVGMLFLALWISAESPDHKIAVGSSRPPDVSDECHRRLAVPAEPCHLSHAQLRI